MLEREIAETSKQLKQPVLPRINRDFVGISHNLQEIRKKRREVQANERAIANRVLLLEKEEIRAQKSLSKKKDQLKKILTKQQITAEELRAKQDHRMQQQKELELLKKEAHERRLQHYHNKQNAFSTLLDHNHRDYQKGKEKLTKDEHRKWENMNDDFLQKRERMISVNIDRDKGRSRIDKFFKKKNKEHVSTYKGLIDLQQSKISQKIQTIEHLDQFETTLRKQLQNSTQRVSQIDSMISKTIQHRGRYSELQTSRMQDQLMNPLHPLKSEATHESAQGSLTQRNSRTSKEEEIQENHSIEEDHSPEEENYEAGKEGGLKIVKVHRKNKHKNRVQHYEAF